MSTKRALAFVYIGYAFRYVSLLVLVPFYGRVLGAAEYGRVLAAMSLFQIVWLLSEYGFPTVGMRDVALAGTPRRLAEVYGQHTGGRFLMTGLGVVTGALGTLASPILRERPIFGVLATLNGLTAAFNLGWYFQGRLRFRTSVLIEVLLFVLNLSFVLVLVRGRDDGWIVLASLLASGVIATTVAHAIALRSMDRSAIRWGCLSLVRESTSLFLARGLAILTSSSSTLLVSVFVSATQVGWYGAAERLATAGLSLMQPAHQVMVSMIAALMGDKKTEQAAYALVRRGLAMLTGLGLVMLVGTLLVAGVAVPLILGPEFGPSVRMLRILSVMFPFAAFAQVIEGYVLVPLRYDRFISVVSFVGAFVTIALTVALGHILGADGVACARCLGCVAMCAVLVHILRREGLVARLTAR